MYAKGKGYLDLPALLKVPPEKRPRGKYCRYHNDHNHNTKGCIHLKNDIERLIKHDHLKRFVDLPPAPEGEKPEKERKARTLEPHP